MINVTDAGKDGITAVEVRRPGVVTAEDWMPLLDLATAVRRRNFMVEVTRTLMVAGVDYGVIPGTGAKQATLLKPGAERLCTLFGLSPELHEVAAIEDWDGTGEGHGEPLFYYRFKCKLTKNGILLGEGIGSCSSRESKFRYRNPERKCPKCGKSAIVRGREEYGGGWLCFGRRGGCGAKFKDGDGAIEGQPAGRVINPDIADITNTVLKMAHKRALVAAVLIATNASEFYTQDAEDMVVIDVPSAQSVRYAPVDPKAPREAKAGARGGAGAKASQETPAKPWRTYGEMINKFAELHGRLRSQDDHIYEETLQEFGVKHSNQFKDVQLAIRAYYRLLERVRECEAAAANESAMIDAAEMLEEIRPPEEEANA